MSEELVYGEVPVSFEKEYLKMQGYGFIPEKGPNYPNKWSGLNIGEKRAVYKDSELVSVGRLLFTEMNVRGDWHFVGGIADIASLPENRRKGYVKKMFYNFMNELDERGVYLTALWPSSYSLYRRFGYEIVGKRLSYQWSLLDKKSELNEDIKQAVEQRNQEIDCKFEFVALHELDFEANELPTTSDEAVKILSSVYGPICENYTMAIKRSSTNWWDSFVTNQGKVSSGTPGYIYAVKVDGNYEGYIIYSISDGPSEDSKSINIRELVYLTDRAYYKLLEFIFDHNLQVENVNIEGIVDEYLQDKFQEPDHVKCELLPGHMLRIVNVKRALENLSYPSDLTGDLYLSVTDEFLPWNNAVYRLEFKQGQLTCHYYSDHSADIYLDIGALSQLYVGYITPEELFVSKRIKFGNKNENIKHMSLSMLKKIFSKQIIYPIEYF